MQFKSENEFFVFVNRNAALITTQTQSLSNSRAEGMNMKWLPICNLFRHWLHMRERRRVRKEEAFKILSFCVNYSVFSVFSRLRERKFRNYSVKFVVLILYFNFVYSLLCINFSVNL